LSPDTLSRFEELFKKINATLEKPEEGSLKTVKVEARS
jgi:hypothetical protein